MLPIPLRFSEDEYIPAASLNPLLCVPYPLDPVEENVLVRLNSWALEEFEYAVDAVDAFEGCRFVPIVFVEYSDCVCRSKWRNDITIVRQEVLIGGAQNV